MLPIRTSTSRAFVLCTSLVALGACGGPMHTDAGDASSDTVRTDTVVGDTNRTDVVQTTDVVTTDTVMGTDVVTTDTGNDDVPVATDEGPDVPVVDDVPAAMDVAPPMDVVQPTDVVTGTDVPPAMDVAPDAPITPGCGNTVLEAGEQCDDGNTRNLDGCDSACRYETISRLTAVAISGSQAPATCTPRTNAFGTRAFGMTGRDQINSTLQTSIDDGSLNIVMQYLGLDDLTGAADPQLTLGVMGAQLDPARGAWPGSNPIDWWYLVDGNGVTATGLPSAVLMPGSLAARALTAGPGMVNFPLSLSGSSLNLQMQQARIIATLNGTPAPNHPAPPPASLDPAINVFQTMTANGAGQGLCGNITVQSLAQIPVPQALTAGQTGACGNCTGSHQYTYCGAGNPVGPSCNSLLDVLVGGCKVVACFVTVVTPTQPDVAGSGTVRPLTIGTGSHVTPSQITGNTDAYSSYLTFTANRAHATGQSCSATAPCQAGQTCTGGFCR